MPEEGEPCPLISLIVTFDLTYCDTVNINGLSLILKIIQQCYIKQNMTFQIKSKTSVLNVSTNIITSITESPTLEVMYASNFKSDAIFYLW